MAWVHGSVTYHGEPVQVEEVRSVRKGFPPTTMGWRAKIQLDGVDIVTTKLCDEPEAAERLLIDQLAALFSRE